MQVRRIAKDSRRVAGVAVAILSAIVVMGGIAYATLQSPSSSELSFTVPGNTAGAPQSFTVVADGFPAGNSVASVEQCDGVSPSTPGYSPLTHCDSATSPAAVDIGSDGVATFPANDPNFGFVPFKGESPQGKFNCIAPGEDAVFNGLPTFSNCQLRVATDLNNTTADQTFFTLALPAAATPAPVGGCVGQVGLAEFTAPLTNQTQVGVVTKTKLLKSVTSKAAIGGDCSTKVLVGDPSQPAGGTATLSAKSVSAKLVGNVSCSATPSGPSAASYWPSSGKIAWTMAQTGADGKPFQIQAQIALSKNAAAGPDVYDVTGTVIKGPGLGAKLGGSIWMDPVIAGPKGATGAYNTGYLLDSAAQAGCAAGTTASVANMLFGGGGASSNSPAGTLGVPGISFTLAP